MLMTLEIKVNKTLAKKVLKVVDKGLVSGLGIQKEGEMCIEAAVCYALGLPHSDNPPCVGEAVRRFKIRLNDSAWPTNKDRTKGMRKLAIAQLGSNKIDQKEFSRRVALKTIQRIVPLVVRYYIVTKNAQYTEGLEILAKQCEEVIDLQKGKELCLEINAKLHTAADAYSAAYYAADAAYSAADAAYYAAADAAYSAADDAAYYAAAAAAYSAAYYAADDARLKVLNLCAEIGLETFIELKSPGCKWLDLCE